MHKVPVGKIRLAQKTANKMVTFGKENDLQVKLWTVGNSNPNSEHSTSQILHKDMAVSKEHDLFAVVAKTSEVKVFGIGLTKNSQEGLEKVMALTNHTKEVLSTSFDANLCLTTSKDETFVLYRLDT